MLRRIALISYVCLTPLYCFENIDFQVNESDLYVKDKFFEIQFRQIRVNHFLTTKIEYYKILKSLRVIVQGKSYSIPDSYFEYTKNIALKRYNRGDLDALLFEKFYRCNVDVSNKRVVINILFGDGAIANERQFVFIDRNLEGVRYLYRSMNKNCKPYSAEEKQPDWSNDIIEFDQFIPFSFFSSRTRSQGNHKRQP